MGIDRRFIQTEGSAVLAGGELLVKGALEAPGGVQVFTGAPVQPLGGYLQALRRLKPWLKAQGQVVRVAPDEGAAVAMLWGAMTEGRHGLAAISTVGLGRASDAIAAMTGVRGAGGRRVPGGGGAVVAMLNPGEGIGGVSHAVDVAGVVRSLGLATLEPGTCQELKDWVGLALDWSGRCGRALGLSIASYLACGGGTVQLHPNREPSEDGRGAGGVTEVLGWDWLLEASRQHGVNRLQGAPLRGERVPVGVVAVGQAVGAVWTALAGEGLEHRVPLLRLGLVWPVDVAMVLELAGQCERLVIVEAGRAGVRDAVQQALVGTPGLAGSGCVLIGVEPDWRRVARALRTRPGEPASASPARARHPGMGLPRRATTFCPGCAHRDTTSVLVEVQRRLGDAQYMLSTHRREPLTLAVVADGGCCALTGEAPFGSLGVRQLGLGLGGAAGLGASAFAASRQLVVLSDVGIAQGGLLAIQDAIHSKRSMTFLVLEDAALSDAEPVTDDSVEPSLVTQPTAARIERLVAALPPRRRGAEVRVVRIDPADRSRLRNLLEHLVIGEGVNIVIADKRCAIPRRRRRQRERRQALEQRGFVARSRRIEVAADVCDFCLECTRQTGCSGLTIQPTPMGLRIQTDPTTCVDDRACAHLYACPSFQEVTVIRRSAPPTVLTAELLAGLEPAPEPRVLNGEAWRCRVAGVAGHGAGALIWLLAEAGHEMGYEVACLHRRDHVARTGPVMGQIFMRRHARPEARTGERHWLSAPIPDGRTDLLLAMDPLEGVSALGTLVPADADRPGALVLNTNMIPTVGQLTGEDSYDPAPLVQHLNREVAAEHRLSIDFRGLCLHWFGHARSMNAMMLGAACQRGLLPVSEPVIQRVIRRVFGADAEQSVAAFTLGRLAALGRLPASVAAANRRSATTNAALLKQNARNLGQMQHGSLRRQRGSLARHYRRLVRDVYRHIHALGGGDPLLRQVIIALHDCIVWGGVDYAERYARRVMVTFDRDDPARHHAITRAVAAELARVMLIKDAVYVAALLSSPRKLRADRERHQVDPRRGDRIRYRHFLRFSIDGFGRRLGLEMRVGLWPLRLLARMKLLRKLVPGWARQQRRFRDHYEQLVDRFQIPADAPPQVYHWWYALLTATSAIRGFGALRQQHLRDARRRLDELEATEPRTFQASPGTLPAINDAGAILRDAPDTPHTPATARRDGLPLPVLTTST